MGQPEERGEASPGRRVTQGRDLSGNQLSTLPDGMFDGLSSLREVDLLLNQMSTLPCGVFDGLSGLQELSLGHIYLSALPHDVFDGLSSPAHLVRP